MLIHHSLRGKKMLILITYDVNTQTSQGVKRLSKVAKICTNYGQRVQNSVFECLVNATQFAMIKKQLLDVVDLEKDSIRYYVLGEQYKNKVEHIGKENGIDMSGTLIC
jgi:CRISPR-associated protein Cas2